jgi:ABC-type lipoprotein export system ATPase subunit
MTAAIDLRDAFRIHGSGASATAALRGLTLKVEHGEVVVVLGPSGAGKTTLLRVLAGLEPLSAGSGRVLGVDFASLGPRAAASVRARALGFVDQHYARSLSPDLTCRQTIALHLRLLGETHEVASTRAMELLERVGLAARAGDRPATLSGGEQQRVAVCAALAHRPGLLLADEPAGELDASNGEIVYRLLAELARDAGATAVVVSHDRTATRVADRVVALHDGRIVEEEQCDDRAALVVSRGWLRIPTRLQRELGEPTRVAADRSGGSVLLTPLAAADTDGRRLRAPARVARTATGEPVAALRGVTRRYGARAVLDGIDCELRPGTLTAFVGRSGSGKTTLLHLLAGLELPTSGEVVVLGTPLAGRSRADRAELRRRHVALVTQEPGLVPWLTAAENVELGLRIRGAPAADARAALRAAGLEARAHVAASRLSAGERQRVAVARALAGQVELLLVDEPTARLDEDSGRRVGALIAAAAHEHGAAVACATHDESLVELADEVVRLDLG